MLPRYGTAFVHTFDSYLNGRKCSGEATGAITVTFDRSVFRSLPVIIKGTVRKEVMRLYRWHLVSGLVLATLFVLAAANDTNSTATAIPRSTGPADTSQNPADAQTAQKKPTTGDSPDQLKANIKRLTSEVERLRRRVVELEKTCEISSLRDRLTKEEQRGEDLQRQLIGVGERESGLQSRMDQVDEQLKPENLDQLRVYGSTRPEQVRESTRNRLTNEKQRLQTQLDQLQQSKTRLQNSLNVTDLVVQRLRLQLQNAARP